MAGKKDKGGASKTNVTARSGRQAARPVVKVFEQFRKPNGALGLRWHWEELA